MHISSDGEIDCKGYLIGWFDLIYLWIKSTSSTLFCNKFVHKCRKCIWFCCFLAHFTVFFLFDSVFDIIFLVRLENSRESAMSFFDSRWMPNFECRFGEYCLFSFLQKMRFGKFNADIVCSLKNRCVFEMCLYGPCVFKNIQMLPSVGSMTKIYSNCCLIRFHFSNFFFLGFNFELYSTKIVHFRIFSWNLKTKIFLAKQFSNHRFNLFDFGDENECPTSKVLWIL